MAKTVEFTHTTPLVSDVVEQAWYASPKRELYVRLKSGNVYGYKDVSPMAYENFCFADSKGKFYNQKIKGVYSAIGNVTDEVEFRSAPGLSKTKTVAQPYLSANYGGAYVTATWPATTTTTAKDVNPVVAKAEAKTLYRVSGTVLKPTATSKSYQATSLEDAMKKFREEFKDAEPEVTAVSKA